MNKTYLIGLAVTGAFLLNACGTTGKAGPDAAYVVTAENTAATVNGKPISKAGIQMLIAEMGHQKKGQAMPEEKVMDEMISHELLSQEAERLRLGKEPAAAARLENAQRMVLSHLAVESYVKTLNFSDADLKKEYDARIGDMKLTELKARHILVDDQETAKELLVKLGKGAKFEELAKKYSKDSASKDKGGELGWFNPQQMVAEFAQAVSSLKNGEVAHEPLHTQFGWHVVQREDSRISPPPSFDEVKEQIRSVLRTKKLQDHIEELRKSAKIERFGKVSKEKE
ncbi:MAG: peptidylprolyl isomerase [Methylococcaceae bacterium]|nr:peptidylprolyl isomerase [Methylococcaceae bacterium]